MKWCATHRAFIALLFVYCSTAAIALAQLLSPGPLSRDHRELEGDDQCTSCHTQGRRVDEQRCTNCHDDIGVERSQRKGLHGTRFMDDTCGHCHVEHRGRTHELIRWPGGTQKDFDHSLTGYDLRGAHAKIQCEDCHTRRNRRGASTFLGLSQACGSCHDDPHERRLGDKCETCHNETDFKQTDLEGFDHDLARFPLRGKHDKVECAKCHGEPAQYRDLEFQRCNDCHEDPHGGRFTAPCASCHDEKGFKHIVMKRIDHPGLSLEAGHSEVRCETCHDQGADVPPSFGKECANCHQPVHEADFSTDCNRCHFSIQWLGLPTKIGRTVHDRTPFPLVGRHQTVECESCHRPQLKLEQRYRALKFERCIDCHRDVHAGEFRQRDGGECGPCHHEYGFFPTRFGLLAHAETAFPLEGNHAAVACSGCHGDETPRLSLRVPQHSCQDCHENPHGDQFAAEMRQGGCAHCHSPLGFDQPRIDHSTWPLTGAHSLAACTSCHNPTEADRLAGNGASYRGVPRECEGCHEDVHAGQFRLTEPMRACQVCHNTERFVDIGFDHAAQADYPLEGGHARLECAACHPTAALDQGGTAVRYRLGYRLCRDCHADPHGGMVP